MAENNTTESGNRNLTDHYVDGLRNLVITSYEAKKLYITNWSDKDKLVNDFFNLSLLTLGAVITVMTAKSNLISNKALLFISLTLLVFEIIFSSIIRLYYSKKISQVSISIYNEFTKKAGSIDVFKIDPTNVEATAKMNVLLQTNDYVPAENWVTNNSQYVIVTVYVVAFLLFALSLIFKISFSQL